MIRQIWERAAADRAVTDAFFTKRYGGLVFIGLANIIILLSIVRLLWKNRKQYERMECVLLCGTWAVLTAAVVILQLLGLYLQADETARLWLLMAEIFVLAGAVAVQCMAERLRRQREAQAAEAAFRQQMQLQNQYAETICRQEERVRRLRHDMHATISTLSGLLAEERTEEMAQYLQGYADRLNRTASVIQTDQPFLNAVVNTKLSAAKEQGIVCICHIPAQLPALDGADYCSLLGNLLDNAIEASAGLTAPEITLDISFDGNLLCMRVRNKTETEILKQNPALRTTKADPQHHGYGVATVREIAEKYDGAVLFFEENGWFHAQVQLYCKET